MRLVDRFVTRLAALRPGTGPLLVAVSGGLDSVVLLDLLVRTRARHGLTLIVAHVDHGIHPESAEVARQVESLAAALGVSCVVGRLRLGPVVSETRARTARYRWLRETRRRLGARWIVTAHQADDQRETVLMRLLRGSGPAGLAGIRPRDRGVLRPLLPFSRQSLARYARGRGLRWWEDPANGDPRHLRSWIRTALLPAVETRLPDVGRKLNQTRRHARQACRSWDSALRSWPGLDVTVGRFETSLSWPALQELPADLAAALVEALIRAAHGPVSPTRIRRALNALRGGQSGARADLGRGWSITLAFGRLRAEPPSRRVAEPPRTIEHLTGEASWGPWKVRWATEPAPARQQRDGRTAWFIPGMLAVRGWRRGDRLAPLGGRGHRLAARCFQDARVPLSQRRSWPMIEAEGRLAWIPGVCRSGRLLPTAGSPALRIDVERRG